MIIINQERSVATRVQQQDVRPYRIVILDVTCSLAWCQDTGVEWHYIAPGKPQQNGSRQGHEDTEAKLSAA